MNKFGDASRAGQATECARSCMVQAWHAPLANPSNPAPSIQVRSLRAMSSPWLPRDAAAVGLPPPRRNACHVQLQGQVWGPASSRASVETQVLMPQAALPRVAALQPTTWAVLPCGWRRGLAAGLEGTRTTSHAQLTALNQGKQIIRAHW